MNTRHRQQGAALLLLASLILAGSSTLLLARLDADSERLRRARHDDAVLAQAREALLGYALAYGDSHRGTVHGYLPCPDSGNSTGEGSSSLQCGSRDESRIGLLPWKTLDSEVLRDSSGACLWYAVSGRYKNNPKTALMNPDTAAQLQLVDAEGGTTTDDIVAIVIAPGAALNGQQRGTQPDRQCGAAMQPADYLEAVAGSGDNRDAVGGRFVQGAPGATVNDRIAYLTRSELWRAIEQRRDFNATLEAVAQALADCLADYARHHPDGNLSLPWAAPLALTDYGNASRYNDRSGLTAGRFPNQVNDARNQSGNTMIGDVLIADNGLNCPHYQAAADTEAGRRYPWWSNWKTHFFYAVAPAFAPHSGPSPGCGDCLTVNGQGPFAAVLLFAGAALPGQQRDNDATRAMPGNYLEGRNAALIDGGNGLDFEHAAPSPAFNDVLYCIDPDLNVARCP